MNLRLKLFLKIKNHFQLHPSFAFIRLLHSDAHINQIVGKGVKYQGHKVFGSFLFRLYCPTICWV